MNNKHEILWITRTSIFIALLIVLQIATAPLGNIYITGSIVNMLLIVSVMTCGFTSGLSVAIVSPMIAKFFGIGPLWILIPFIAAANIALIIMWHFIGNKKTKYKYASFVNATISAAAAKFLILYFGIVKIAVPIFLNLPEQQTSLISNMFSIPQIITALIGGIIATGILPVLKKAIPSY